MALKTLSYPIADHISFFVYKYDKKDQMTDKRIKSKEKKTYIGFFHFV